MKLIGDQKKFVPYINLLEIDQFEGFRKIIGYTPVIGKYYRSLFRPDKTPECRFELFNGYLFFIDNAGYKGKLSFNLIETVQELYGTDIKGALEILSKHNITSPIRNYSSKVNEIDIRFTYLPWKECGFTNKTKLSCEYLSHQPVFLVKDYWCNTKKDSRILKNRFLKPDIYETIAYHFPNSNKTKLYWPEAPHNKFYTNISVNDIYGSHRYHEYIGEDIFIVKSGKDDLVVNYHLGLNTLGVQTEHQKFQKDLIELLEPFENIYIWYDNDKTGKESSQIRGLELKEQLPHHKIYLIYVPNNAKNMKDPGDIVENNLPLNEILNTALNFKKEIK